MRLLPIIFLIFSTVTTFAQPTYEFDLRDLMDAHYGVGMWSYRTTPCTGTDIGPAMQDAKNAIYAMPNRSGKIKIPPGNWAMVASPGDLSGIVIEGESATTSVILYCNASGIAFYFSGAASNGGGIRHLGIMLESGLGNTSSYGILLRGNAQFQPDQMTFEDIYLTGLGSYWWDGFDIDGSARSTPQGVRVGTLNNVQVFQCRNMGIMFANAVQWTMVNVGIYTGVGPYANTLMVNTNTTHLYGMGVNSAMSIGPSIDVWINGTRYF